MYSEEINHIYKNIYTNVTRDELAVLQNLAKTAKQAIEIGSYLGASSYAIASEMKDFEKLHCIDIWESNTKLRPDPKTGTLYENFIKNTEKFKKNIVVIKDFSYNVADLFHDKTIDLLFIDGEHSYDGVLKDWELYHKKMKPGGIVVFHDWGWDSVKKVIQEYVTPYTHNHGNLPNMWWATIK